MVTSPAFGSYLQHLRRATVAPGFTPGVEGPPRQRISRDQLANNAGISVSYLSKLEQGYPIHPTREVVDQLADALAVNDLVREHLHDLVDYTYAKPVPIETAPLSPSVITAEQRQHVEWLCPNLAGWVTEAWWVLYGNREYCRIYRHLEEVRNILIWFFAVPESRKIMVEWDVEARLTVAWLRSHMVRRAEDHAFVRLLDELSKFPEFVRMWEQQQILMGRHSPYMRIRDLDNSEEMTLLANVYRHPDPTSGIQLYVGARPPRRQADVVR
ncbi:helix-turn-helix domain-containing protein [Nonomuraea dietziae]|uniref:Transcriptional regulator with XRE-family HTH domain n=1 Tax=Nonomuraea dietziae TaxID=65515 RepID=A0A7W5VK79_9ACTN|nr:helix-turn-helix domain-containing protein [Nonomuraea dietziae]MBB3733830.1 transcriptional regulator with XRE-family HTH domain [Nonomuraea dietziae]